MGTSTVKTSAGVHSQTTITTEKPRQLIYPINSNRSKKNKSFFRRKVSTEAPSTERHKSDVRESSSSIVNVAVNSKYSKEIDEMNNLDYGLMTMSAAGEGNNKTDDEVLSKTTSNSNKDESKKTLSDQIAEGKYGLIEKELFSKTPKAPGIISYKVNPETPNDNDKNFGGLRKDEIWLAEDHLLVLKGGIPNERADDEDWKPIDDYEAPKRPVKIPINPRVPPPFPVQLADNGPLQFIGNNQFSLVNTFANETGLFNNEKGTTKTNSADKTNIFTGYGTVKNFTKDQVHDVIPPPPWLYNNNNKDDLLKQFPFNLPLPNLDPTNKSDEFDEDDPSLFYPPPYSFVYHVNYTNLAPVGPLVPGIILPPPPNFFSVYHPEQDRKPIKTPIDVLHRIQDNHLKSRLTTSSPLPSTPSPVAVIPLREVVRNSKVSPSQAPKVKSTTLRTTVYTTTPNTVRKAVEKQKFDTTTLKLHPVYVPASVTTKLYSTTTPKSTVINNQIYKNNDYGSQKHPIYFEYFDARTSNPIKPPYIQSDYESKYTNPSIYSQTTPTPIYKETIKSKKPKTFYTPQFISTTISPASIDAKYLYVTAKPENIYGSVISSVKPYPSTTEASSQSISYNSAINVPQKPLILKPVKFDEEIDAIRQTLDYYGGNKYNFPQKKPKVKAIYEFSFEANQPIKHEENFQPILSYDQKTQNYYTNKPEINYKDISELIKYNNDNNNNKNNFYQSTTESPIQYYRAKQAATLPQKNNPDPDSTRTTVVFGQKIIRPQNANYYVTNKMPWIERPIYKEISTQQQQQQHQQQQFQQQQPQKIISYQPSYEATLPVQADNYRINNRNIKYRKPAQQQQQQQQQQQHHQQNHQQHHQQQQQQYGGEIASLVNDTLVNYRYPQRPINPYSEFIDISRLPSQNQPLPQHQPIPHPPPPQYQPYPFFNHRPNQQLQQQYHHVPLDVIKFNSNFEYPLPQINPESVSITFYNRPVQKVSPNNNYYVTPRN